MADIQISLAAARVNAGLKQSEASKMMHISRETLIKWEKGDVTPSFADLFTLSSIYHIPIDNISLPKKST